MPTNTPDYEPLATHYDDDDENVASTPQVPKSKRRSGVRLLTWLSMVVNALLSGWIGWLSVQSMHRLPWKGLKPLYSEFALAGG